MNQKGNVILIVLLIAVVVGGYLVYTNYSNNRTEPNQQYTQTTQTPNPIPQDQQKQNSYTNSSLKLQFFYPSKYSSINDVKGLVTISLNQLGSMGIRFVPKNHLNFIDFNKLEPCSVVIKNLGNLPPSAMGPLCLENGAKFGQNQDIADIEIIDASMKKVNVKSAFLSYPAIPNTFQILQTTKDPIIQISPSDPGEPNSLFQQLLKGINFN